MFTSNATQAVKLVAETFTFNCKESTNENSNKGNRTKETGHFVYLEDNHTSILGMRTYAKNFLAITQEEAFEIFSKKFEEKQTKTSLHLNSLFAYPAQSNFSGTKYPLEWIEKTQKGQINNFKEVVSKNWYCLLDAACFVSTSKLDLSLYKPDFVPVSFYKIFGFPTGIGALIVKNTSGEILRKKYFGGGTVFLAASLDGTVVHRKTLHER